MYQKRHVLQEEMECGRYGKKSVLFTKEIDTDCIWLQDTQWSVIKAEVSSRGLGLGVRETRGDTLRTATTKLHTRRLISTGPEPRG